MQGKLRWGDFVICAVVLAVLPQYTFMGEEAGYIDAR